MEPIEFFYSYLKIKTIFDESFKFEFFIEKKCFKSQDFTKFLDYKEVTKFSISVRSFGEFILGIVPDEEPFFTKTYEYNSDVSDIMSVLVNWITVGFNSSSGYGIHFRKKLEVQNRFIPPSHIKEISYLIHPEEIKGTIDTFKIQKEFEHIEI